MGWRQGRDEEGRGGEGRGEQGREAGRGWHLGI